MIHVLWPLPILIVIILVASRRASTVNAGLCGLVVTILVALISNEGDFGALQAVRAVARGIWLALLVGGVIFGGLFFRDMISSTQTESRPLPLEQRRGELYAACFLFGPFAEAATGFGVGQMVVAPVLKRAGLVPIDAVLFGLFSQIMVPWGALANGTIVGAQLSGLSPADLGIHSAVLTAPLLLGWLCLFWLFAARAGVYGSWDRIALEFCITVALAGLLVIANIALGPEVAGMAALAPLIVIRTLSGGIESERLGNALAAALPYAVLICGIATTRAISPVNEFLANAIVRPFADGPPWFPFLHPATWLLGVGAVTAVFRGRGASILGAIDRSWMLGRISVLTIMLFLAMAQVMRDSGMASACAQAIQTTLGPAAAIATPLFAGLFGFLTSSSSTANGLLMPAQAALAQWGPVSLPWLAALQNVAAAALTMLSPVRLAVGCSLVGRVTLERDVYAKAWPLAALPLSILTTIAAVLVIFSPAR